MYPIKLAIIGCGTVVNVLYVPALRKIADRCQVVAVADKHTTRANKIASFLGAKIVTTDYELILDKNKMD